MAKTKKKKIIKYFVYDGGSYLNTLLKLVNFAPDEPNCVILLNRIMKNVFLFMEGDLFKGGLFKVLQYVFLFLYNKLIYIYVLQEYKLIKYI